MAEALKWATIVNDETGELLVDDEIANDYPRTTNEATMKLKKGEVIYLQFGNMVDSWHQAPSDPPHAYTPVCGVQYVLKGKSNTVRIVR